MNTTVPIRIIVVDDHQLARESLSLLLGYDSRFNIIRECANGNDAIETAQELKPDIMLVDINMDPMNGFDVTKEMKRLHPSIKIIGISVNNHPLYASHMIEMGAKGFVTKGTSFDEMAHAILEVNEGRTYISRDIRLAKVSDL